MRLIGDMVGDVIVDMIGDIIDGMIGDMLGDINNLLLTVHYLVNMNNYGQ